MCSDVSLIHDSTDLLKRVCSIFVLEPIKMIVIDFNVNNIVEVAHDERSVCRRSFEFLYAHTHSELEREREEVYN